MEATRSGGRCVELVGEGAPDAAMRMAERPAPEAAPGTVAIRVRAAGVAFADVKMRHGIYPGAPPFPFVPGYDVAGEVVAGAGFAPGERVAALTFTGGYAEHVAVDARRVARMPARMPAGAGFADATACVLNYVTAWQMIERVARVPDGATILVHGGGGGAGTALLDLARRRGLRAFATASAGKHDLVRRYGGLPIDYRAADFVPVLRDAGGADAVFDHVGGGHLLRSAQAAKRGGTVVGYGFAGGVSDRAVVRDTYAAFARLLLRPGLRARFYGILSPPFSQRRHIQGDLERVLALLGAGAITPHVGARLPLDRAAEAHAMLEAGQSEGKIVLEP